MASWNSLSFKLFGTTGLAMALMLAGLLGTELYNGRSEMQEQAERRAQTAIDMLESVHVNSMLHRGQVEDNDPAIDTLNGTLEQFSSQSDGVEIWLVMAPKVVEFQRANGQNEIEEARDAIDREALGTGKPVVRHQDGSLRVSRPVILGQGAAADPKCASCHGALMGIGAGEPIGAYSAAIDMTGLIAAWNRSAIAEASGGLAIMLAVLALGFFLMRSTLIKPLNRIASAAEGFDEGSEALIEADARRKDVVGVIARSMQTYRTNLADRQRLEIETLRANEMAMTAQSADRAKSEFLANMSHEIRTPMNGIMGMAELLAKTELDARQKMFADVIVKSGSALLTIINDILDFSKLDAGQMQIEPVPFGLRDALEDVATLVSARAAEKDIEVIVRVDPSLPEMVIGDPGRIRQVITNLIGNAVKFTEFGHVLLSVTGKVRETQDGHAASILVSVEDTGIGIPRDKLDAVFDKFTQVDGSATRRHEGTGLGLSIASGLIRLMGGEIGADSEVGKGSKFWVRLDLPVHGEAHAGRRKEIADLAKNLTGARVLVADDNAVNREILLEQLSSWRFDAAGCHSGEELIGVLDAVSERGIAVDAILLDYQMPGMTGGDTLAEIRKRPQYRDLPAIVLSSIDDLEVVRELKQLGIFETLTKPARSSLLLETLTAAISQARGADAGEEKPAMATPAGGDDKTSAAPVSTPAKTAGQEMRPPATTIPAVAVDVLVAEDNEVNQLFFSRILIDADLTFRIASNGDEAIAAYRESGPRLILMDVSMPGVDGIAATEAIRRLEEESGAFTPIIGVTAHALRGDEDKCLDAGMDDYVAKPVSPGRLMEKISEWIDTGHPARKAGAKARHQMPI